MQTSDPNKKNNKYISMVWASPQTKKCFRGVNIAQNHKETKEGAVPELTNYFLRELLHFWNQIEFWKL